MYRKVNLCTYIVPLQLQLDNCQCVNLLKLSTELPVKYKTYIKKKISDIYYKVFKIFLKHYIKNIFPNNNVNPGDGLRMRMVHSELR